MKRRRAILEFVLENLITLIVCFCLGLLLGMISACSSHKTSCIVESSSTSVSAIHKSESYEDIDAKDSVVCVTSAEKIWSTFTADSIVTPKGAIIYYPRFNSGVELPTTKSTTISSSKASSVSAEADSTAQVAIADKSVSKDADAIAVTKPPNGNSILWVIFPAIILAILIVLYRWKKK